MESYEYKGFIGVALALCILAIVVVVVSAICGKLLIAGTFAGVALVWACVIWHLVKEYRRARA